MDPAEQSAPSYANFYGPEVMNKTGCTVEMNRDMILDPRYIDGNMVTNEYIV